MSDIVKREDADGKEIAVVDKDDSQSVYNLVHETLKKAIDRIPEEVWLLPFSEVSRKAKVDVDWRKCRLAFWIEYERAVRCGQSINIGNCTKGILNSRHFLNTVASDFWKLAFILTPPEDYTVKLEEMLILALDEERKILDEPLVQKKIVVTKDGDVVEKPFFDTKLGDLKHKIRESIHTRRFGAPVQRMLSKNINENHDKTGKSPQEMEIEELEAMEKELDARRTKVIELDANTDGEDGVKDE